MALLRPSESFEENVLSPWKAYKNSPHDRGLARAAAHAANSEIEWRFKYYEANDPSRLNGAKHVGDFRNQLAAECPDIWPVWDVADNGKHRVLTRNTSHRIHCTATATFVDTEEGLALTGDDRPFSVVLDNVVTYLGNCPD